MPNLNNPRLRIENPQFRTCPKCQAPMLLMMALPTPNKAATITKKYECYVCHSAELIEEAARIASWLTSPGLAQPR